jgi:superfamily I DNA and/or RNA helicase
VNLIKKKLAEIGFRDVLVSTVDASQGCEADIVVVSFVRTTSAGFLDDDRRINVALTRARNQLTCVGKVNEYLFMQRAHTLCALASYAEYGSFIVPAWHQKACDEGYCSESTDIAFTKTYQIGII